MESERRIKAGQARALLERCGLSLSAREPDYTVGIYDDEEELLATGSLVGDMLQMIAVSPEHQGEDLSAKVVTHLLTAASQKGLFQLHLFTKAEKAATFRQLGFRLVVSVPQKAALLEWGSNGIGDFCRGLRERIGVIEGTTGALVMNCNPFTKGHRYLVEQASARCDRVVIFSVQEDLSVFPFPVRYDLLKKGVADLSNVTVAAGGRYVVSSLTFPSYFTKSTDLADVQAAVDMAIFKEHIAPALGITDRFLGTEPFSPVTELYNRAAVEQLEPAGIHVHLVNRLELDGEAVSASRVRALLAENRLDEVQRLVAPATWSYLNSPEAASIRFALQKGEGR